MTDKITLPMGTSKGIEFNFTVEGITEGQAKNLLGQIIDTVSKLGLTLGGGFFSGAYLEEINQGMDWEDFDPDLLDMVDDDISLDDLFENMSGDDLDELDHLYGYK